MSHFIFRLHHPELEDQLKKEIQEKRSDKQMVSTRWIGRGSCSSIIQAGRVVIMHLLAAAVHGVRVYRLSAA